MHPEPMPTRGKHQEYLYRDLQKINNTYEQQNHVKITSADNYSSVLHHIKIKRMRIRSLICFLRFAALYLVISSILCIKLRAIIISDPSDMHMLAKWENLFNTSNFSLWQRQLLVWATDSITQKSSYQKCFLTLPASQYAATLTFVTMM